MAEMADWMAVNSEAIFGTRPFKINGEGPTQIKNFGQHELPYTPRDIRFTTQGGTLYAIVLGTPENEFTIASLAQNSPLVSGEITGVEMIGQLGALKWERTDAGLTIHLPGEAPNKIAVAFKIAGLTDLAFDGLIYPAMNGEFTLGVAAAERHGQQFVVANEKDQPHMAAWSKDDEWLSWRLKISRPGTYAIRIVSSAAGGESTFTIEADGASLIAKFPGTPTWDDFRTVELGKLTVKEAGATTIRFKPAVDKAWRPLNLVSIMLQREKK